MQYLCLLVQQKLHVLHAHNTMSIVSNVHCSTTETSKNDVNILIWSCYVVLCYCRQKAFHKKFKEITGQRPAMQRGLELSGVLGRCQDR